MKAINIMLASKDEVEPMSEETAQEFNKMLNKYRGGILKDIENYLKLNVMNKDEAKEKLRRAESDLRQAEIVMEMHENGVRELREDIEKLKAIINKKDDWKLVEVPDNLQELYREKAYLMADMMRFAYVRNEGWVPDWENCGTKKWGLIIDTVEGIYLYSHFNVNLFIFGIAVKSEEIAEEMLEEFGGRIKDIYNKQY